MNASAGLSIGLRRERIAQPPKPRASHRRSQPRQRLAPTDVRRDQRGRLLDQIAKGPLLVHQLRVDTV